MAKRAPPREDGGRPVALLGPGVQRQGQPEVIIQVMNRNAKREIHPWARLPWRPRWGGGERVPERKVRRVREDVPVLLPARDEAQGLHPGTLHPDEGAAGRQAVNGHKMEEIKTRIKNQKSTEPITPLLDLLADLETERQELKGAIDRLSLSETCYQAEVLGEAHGLLDLMETTPRARRRDAAV